MRGLDPTAPLARFGVRWRLLILAVLLGALSPAFVAAVPADKEKEAVRLAAYRVRTWEDGPKEQWIILHGRAAIFRGAEGIRADLAVVRIVEGDNEYQVDVYAEGGEAGKARRLAFRTAGKVELSQYTAKPEAVPTGSNAADLALVRRGFPDDAVRKNELPPATATRRTATRDDAPHETKFQAPPEDEPAGDDPAFPEIPVIDDPDVNPPGGGADDALGLDPLDGMPPMPSPVVVAPVVPQPGLDAQPILPGSQRVVNVFLRQNARDSRFRRLRRTADGTDIFEVTGGVTLVAESFGRFGTVDVSADNAIIWTRLGDRGAGGGGDGVKLTQDADDPLEIYLEGNVVFRQDERKVAGQGDEKLVEARRFYMDFRRQRFVALEGEFDQFVADFVSPVRTMGPRIQQFKDVTIGPNGKPIFGPSLIQSEETVTTGSRFPYPGYRFRSRSVDLTELRPTPLTDPTTGSALGDGDDPNTPKDTRYQIDARQNVFYIGSVPVFYWPRVLTTSDDLDPPLRRATFRANNVFGQQFLTDWSGFKLFGLRKPATGVDQWNVDIDYLSYRGIALGSEFGYYGKDFSKEILGYDLFPGLKENYFGYFDIWGLRDYGIDNLGPGPAILNNTPPTTKLFQRSAVPPLQDFRGRFVSRHMQTLNAKDADPLDDTRFQLELGYISDRNFLEEYYKRLFDSGMDQSTLFYLIRQRQNRAFTFLTEGNLQNWYTDSQWLPKLDYYRLGDSLLGDRLTYFQHSGVNYANTHTSIEVNNPNTFAFLPYDPVSNTSGPFSAFRAYTAHEVDYPLDFGFVRVIPYAQGQLTGWNTQLDGQAAGRAWGAGGARLNAFAWKVYPGVESELMNVHGLAHKMSIDLDFRTAYSNYSLNRLAVQDDLDDNTYEYVRRYFTMTQFVGGLLPLQYDPRLLALRRTVSPITGSVDIQDNMETLRLETHHRLQTKRGPEGARRVTDYMTLDVGTTYFPNANRDNFGTPFGQTTYNFEWYLGDRTSFLSTGWFEYFDVTGRQLLANAKGPVDSQGIQVINAGILVNRPPRGSVYLGYYIINSGPISTSALNGSYGYWLSPKWYGSVSMSYDFGNNILLGTTGSLTRVGADFLTSIGLTVDPQRQSYTFGFEIVPRLSPNLRLGSGNSLNRFDSRFAAYE